MSATASSIRAGCCTSRSPAARSRAGQGQGRGGVAMPLTPAQARARLQRMVQDGVDPTLASGDVDDLMLIAAVPYTPPLQDLWQATPYAATIDPFGALWRPPDHVVTIAPDSLASW